MFACWGGGARQFHRRIEWLIPSGEVNEELLHLLPQQSDIWASRVGHLGEVAGTLKPVRVPRRDPL